MKAYILIISVLAAFSANAATIGWGATSLYYGTNKTTSSDTVGYLVYLGNSASYDSIDFATLAKTGTSYTSVADSKTPGSTTTAKGKVNKQIGSNELLNGLSSSIVDGSTYFGTVYIYNNGTDSYYLTGGTHLYDTSKYDNVASEEFQWQTDAISSNSSTDAQGWKAVPAVPEPATGALALAGIALLFKRRKARA